MDVKLVAQAGVIVGAVQQSTQAAGTLWGEGWALPTRCLSFDKQKGGYGPVSVSTTAVAEASVSVAGGDHSQKKSAGHSILTRSGGDFWMPVFAFMGLLFL